MQVQKLGVIENNSYRIMETYSRKGSCVLVTPERFVVVCRAVTILLGAWDKTLILATIDPLDLPLRPAKYVGPDFSLFLFFLVGCVLVNPFSVIDKNGKLCYPSADTAQRTRVTSGFPRATF